MNSGAKRSGTEWPEGVLIQGRGERKTVKRKQGQVSVVDPSVCAPRGSEDVT